MACCRGRRPWPGSCKTVLQACHAWLGRKVLGTRTHLLAAPTNQLTVCEPTKAWQMRRSAWEDDANIPAGMTSSTAGTRGDRIQGSARTNRNATNAAKQHSTAWSDAKRTSADRSPILLGNCCARGRACLCSGTRHRPQCNPTTFNPKSDQKPTMLYMQCSANSAHRPILKGSFVTTNSHASSPVAIYASTPPCVKYLESRPVSGLKYNYDVMINPHFHQSPQP